MMRMYSEDQETTVQINITTDTNDLLEIYRSNNKYLLEVITRLINLKDYAQVAVVWSEALPKLTKDHQCLLIIVNKLKINAKEICDAGKANFFIRTLLDLALAYPRMFEAFRICQTISELVIQNREFPSKATAILYFQTIAELCKTGSSTLSFLNALHVLNELEPLAMPRGELNFLARMASHQTEVFAKDIFCGIKAKDVEKIAIGVVDTKYEADSRTAYVLNALDTEEGLENTMENVSFLLKHSIDFITVESRLRRANSSNEGFTSMIFKIVKQYEPSVVPEEKPAEVPKKITEKPPVQQKTKNPEAVKDVTPKIQFKNRFTVPYKRYKLVKMYMNIDFEDTYYEERNRRRAEMNEIRKLERENEKNFLLPYREVVEELINDLNQLRDNKEMEERRILLEKTAIAVEEARSERKSKMWRNEPRTTTAAKALDNRSSVNLSESAPNDGLYKPNFAAMNLTMANLSVAENSRGPSSLGNRPAGSPGTKGEPWRKKVNKKE